jgi:hypothetical protein
MNQQPKPRPRWASLRIPAHKCWLIAAYVIFAAYLIHDGFIFLLNPYSGRLSTFVCAPDSGGKMVCTVTIYGLRGISRRSFPAEDFISARDIIEWNGSSSDATHGITISTKQGLIDFIPAIEDGRYIHGLREQINGQFIDGEPIPSISIVHFRPDPSFSVRAYELAVGFMLLLLALCSRRDLLRFDATRLGKRKGFWSLAVYWAKYSILVRLLFFLLLFRGSFIFSIIFFSSFRDMNCVLFPACNTAIHAHPEYFEFPMSYLLCLYPLVWMPLVLALVQRQMLARVNVRVSRWWVAAPLAASLPLMIIKPDLNCDDCMVFSGQWLLLYEPFEYPMLWGLGLYYLALGLIQWLVLRRQLASASIWVIMPLANQIFSVGFLLIPLIPPLQDWIYDISTLGRLILMFALFIIGQIMRELVPAMTMSRLVNRSKPVHVAGT